MTRPSPQKLETQTKLHDKKLVGDLVTALEIINNIIWNGSNSFQCRTFHHETRFGTLWLPLCADNLTSGLSLSLQLIILLLPETKFLSAP